MAGARKDGQDCNHPIFLAGGANADAVLELDHLFSPLVPASKFPKAVLETLWQRGQETKVDVSTYALLASKGPYENATVEALQRLLPVSRYDREKVESGCGTAVQGCRDDCEGDDDDDGDDDDGYCHPADGSPPSGPWTPRFGPDAAAAGDDAGCGAWDLGYSAGPSCTGSSPDSKYAIDPSGDTVDGIAYKSIFDPASTITGSIYESLNTIFELCGSIEDDPDECHLDVLLAVGHSRQFQQYVRVLGTFIEQSEFAKLPSAAVFIDGLRPTKAMEDNRKNGNKAGNKDVYPYKGWLGTASWHPRMGDHSNLGEEFLGDSRYFEERIRNSLGDPGAPVTTYHAEAAAALVLLQLALGKLESSSDYTDKVKMEKALRSVDEETFYGRINITEKGWNQRDGKVACAAAVLQYQEYDKPPVLVGPPDLVRPPGHLIFNPFSPGTIDPGCGAGDLLKSSSWDRDPRDWCWLQIGVSLGLLVVATIAVYHLCTRQLRKRKGGGAGVAPGGGIMEGLLGSVTASELLPGTAEIKQRWEAATPRPSQEIELEELQTESPGSSGRMTRLLSRNTSPRNSATGPTAPRPKDMFKDSDTKDLKDERKIGTGSFGVVYQARWKGAREGGGDLQVAVKELILGGNDETPMRQELARDLLRDFTKEVEVYCGLGALLPLSLLKKHP